MSLNPLNDISRVYLQQIAEMSDAGEDQEHKYKKSGKKSKDYDEDGEVEDESDEYAGVKDRAIKKATGKVCKECGKKKCECDEDDDMNEAVHATAKKMHSPHEVPSGPPGTLQALVKKAVKRIDTDVDGDTDNNDKAKGELGEFIPGVGNKRLYSTTKTTTAKESFSNWRSDLIEVADEKEGDKQLKEMPKNKSNTIKINPVLGEAISSIGGTVLEEIEYEKSESVDIFEEITDAEIYFMDDEFIYDIVEETIVELLDEGYDLDYIVDSIVESVDNSLQMLEEGVAETAARKRRSDVNRAQLRVRAKTLRPDPATLRRNARMKAVKGAAQKAGENLKTLVKKGVEGTSYAAGYGAGAAVRGARAIARKAGEGFKRGSQGPSQSSSTPSSSTPSSSTPSSSGTRAPQPYRNTGAGTRDRVSADDGGSQTQTRKKSGGLLKRAIKGAVRLGASAVEVGAGAIKSGARYVRKRMSEEFILESSEIAAEYFYEQGLNEDGVEILIDELGLDEFAEFVVDLSEEMVLTEARRGGVRVEPVTKTGKSVGSLKGGPKTSAINRLRKEKAARREAEAKASASKPSGFRSFSQSVAAKKPQRVAAVASAKKQQPKKKGALDRLAGVVLRGMEGHQQATAAALQAFNKRMERHRSATTTASNLASQTAKTVKKAAEVGAKGASEFGKGVSSGVKDTATAAKKVKKALNAGYEMDGESIDEAGDWWHPDPKTDRLLGGPGANQRAREDNSTPSSPKKNYSKSLKTGETYMQFAKRRAAERNKNINSGYEMEGNLVDEKVRNPYAIGMAAAMDQTGDRPPLKKSTITKAHKIAKRIEANESITGEVVATPQQAALQRKSAAIDTLLAKLRARQVQQQIANSKKEQR